ncbi:ribonuclease H-like domain-containing protein [Tanacetum coccineum]
MEVRGIFDSGFSGHNDWGTRLTWMILKNAKGGYVTYRGSKGTINSKVFDLKPPSLTKSYDSALIRQKSTSEISKLWHRRLGHINFKNLNKLVKGNLVRGLPSKNGNMLEFSWEEGNKQGYTQCQNSTAEGFADKDRSNMYGYTTNPNANASEEEDEAEELIIVPPAIKHTQHN